VAFSPKYFACGLLLHFFAQKISSFLWQTAFGEWRLANGAKIWQISAHNLAQILLVKLNGNFLPNAVRQRLFAWQIKVDEIDP